MKTYMWIMMVVTLVGCSTMQVTSEYEPGMDFVRLKSFDFATGNTIQAADPSVNITEARQLVRTIIADALTAKGYRRQTTVTPDFLIGYRVIGTNKEEESATDPFTIGSGPQWEDLPRTPHVREYREGTLVLTVGDPVTKKVVWRAAAAAEISRSISSGERVQKIREAVAQLLAKFPPH